MSAFLLALLHMPSWRAQGQLYLLRLEIFFLSFFSVSTEANLPFPYCGGNTTICIVLKTKFLREHLVVYL
jgi:hypothetical protein